MGFACEIIVDVKKHITGEPITGIVKIGLHKDVEFKKISLSFVEEGEFEWAETQKLKKPLPDNTTVYLGNERNVIEKIYFLNGTTDGNTMLRAGSYEFPFIFIVPENTPPTMKTRHGEIRYQLELKFENPERYICNRIFKKRIFSIFPKLDSSLTDEPIIVLLNKTLFKLFSSKKHEITIQAELDKGYSTPGGKRNLTFVVNNKSDVIFSIKTELIRKTKYIAGEKTKTVIKVIKSSTVETPQIPDYSVSTMFNIIPVSNWVCTVKHSKVVERECILRITLKLPLPHVNSSVEIPLFVGENPMILY